MPRQSLLSLPILLYNNYIVSMTEPSWAYITTYIAIKRWTDLPISKQRNNALPARKLEDDCIHGGGGDSGRRNCGAGHRRGLEEGWRPSAWTLSTDIYKTSRRPVPFSTIYMVLLFTTNFCNYRYFSDGSFCLVLKEEYVGLWFS